MPFEYGRAVTMDIEGLCMLLGFGAVLLILPMMGIAAEIKHKRKG